MTNFQARITLATVCLMLAAGAMDSRAAQPFEAADAASTAFVHPLIGASEFAGGPGQAGVAEDSMIFAAPSEDGAVPDPSNWIMILTGLAVVGGVLRRRRAAPWRASHRSRPPSAEIQIASNNRPSR